MLHLCLRAQLDSLAYHLWVLLAQHSSRTLGSMLCQGRFLGHPRIFFAASQTAKKALAELHQARGQGPGLARLTDDTSSGQRPPGGSAEPPLPTTPAAYDGDAKRGLSEAGTSSDRSARRPRVPIAPGGTGSSLSGGLVPAAGGRRVAATSLFGGRGAEAADVPNLSRVTKRSRPVAAAVVHPNPPAAPVALG